MTQHTLGPWQQVHTGETGLVFAQIFDQIHFIAEETDKANARLIAASPDLLEALKNCMEWMEDLRTSGDAGNWEWKNDQYTQAMTVIAKATGEKNGN